MLEKIVHSIELCCDYVDNHPFVFKVLKLLVTIVTASMIAFASAVCLMGGFYIVILILNALSHMKFLWALFFILAVFILIFFGNSIYRSMDG